MTWLFGREKEYVNEWRKYAGKPKFFEKDSSGYSMYNQYLESNIWKSKRKKKLKSVGYRCEQCGAVDQKNTTLDVHHETYARVTKERLSDLVVLCRNCHKTRHPGW